MLVLESIRKHVRKRKLTEESTLGSAFLGRDGEELCRIKMISNPDSQCLPCSQEKVRAVFDNLIQLEHLNIVKFHKYWADIKENKARVRTFS